MIFYFLRFTTINSQHIVKIEVNNKFIGMNFIIKFSNNVATFGECQEYCVKSVNKACKRHEMQGIRSSEASQGESAYLVVKADGKIYRLHLAEILLLDALGDYVRIHTGSAIITTHDTLKNLEKSLPGDLFMRVHRSYIIALDKIHFLEGNRLRIGEQDIPLGQSYRDHLLQYLQRKSKNGEG